MSRLVISLLIFLSLAGSGCNEESSSIAGNDNHRDGVIHVERVADDNVRVCGQDFSNPPCASMPETNPNPVPEPATIFLLGSALLGLFSFRKRI